MRDPCAYCQTRDAVNKDHVVPKSLRRAHTIPDEFQGTVPACFSCNMRKGQRRLVPPSWAHLIPQLNEHFGGTPWRTWDGNPMSPAFREVHV